MRFFVDVFLNDAILAANRGSLYSSPMFSLTLLDHKKQLKSLSI